MIDRAAAAALKRRKRFHPHFLFVMKQAPDQVLQRQHRVDQFFGADAAA